MADILFFTAPWCPTCKAMIPQVVELAGKYHKELTVYDVESFPDVAVEHSVSQLPTVLFLKHGLEAARLAGMQPKQTLMKFVSSY